MLDGVSSNEMGFEQAKIDANRQRFPYCVVWTPIPLLTWLFPVIGHMGIATSAGVIRDFAGPYYVSEDDMAFGSPTKYWRMNPKLLRESEWDDAVHQASEDYKHQMHNLCCNNCHSHVATALNLMKYNGSTSWNMFKLAFLILIYGKYVNFWAVLKTWLPFLIIVAITVTLLVVFH
ncbi:transmembrane protein 222-like [Oscarella lobularis]|uniref:transmembrane protein 222-like n=1 Tax=Oscarella lobularis TaxID=121494 RepID=UPI003313DB2F